MNPGGPVRNIFCSLLAVTACGCAALENDQWSWMGDPERMHWEKVVIQAYGREVAFEIPDRRENNGEHVRIWPAHEERNGVKHIVADLAALQDILLPIAQFRWDEYWQGFYKPGDRDFTLNIDAYIPEERGDLLDLDSEQRKQAIMEENLKLWSKSGSEFSNWVEQHYWADTYETPYHVWVVENQPQVTWRHEYYLMPLTDDIELIFRFFVREKRWDRLDDPVWRESRWTLVRQIMDSVQITPPPFPDEP